MKIKYNPSEGIKARLLLTMFSDDLNEVGFLYPTKLSKNEKDELFKSWLVRKGYADEVCEKHIAVLSLSLDRFKEWISRKEEEVKNGYIWCRGNKYQVGDQYFIPILHPHSTRGFRFDNVVFLPGWELKKDIDRILESLRMSVEVNSHSYDVITDHLDKIKKMKEKFDEFKTYEESLDFLKDISLKKNEYVLRKDVFLTQDQQRVKTIFFHTLILEDLVENIDEINVPIIVKKRAIKRFHPNKINNKDFWVKARERFPYLTICGQESKTINDVNLHTNTIPQGFGFFDFLENLSNESDKKLSLLEIGFGYGGFFFEIKDQYEYYGIDYIIPKTLKKYKNFIEIKQSGIPDYFNNFLDVVYSVNVFQHCSQNDRFDYIQQAYDSLKPGGHFLFTLFLMTTENQNKQYWGVIDDKGRGYTHFLNQLTECDWEHELVEHIRAIGFKIINVSNSKNFYSLILQK